MTTNNKFIDWFHTFDPAITEEKYKKRIKAFDVFAKNVEYREGLDAVRVFYGISPSDKNFMKIFVEIFTKADPTFSTSGKNNEIRVLAGCAALHYSNTEADDHDSLDVKLSFVTLACKGKGLVAPIPDIVQTCQNDLIEASKKLRSKLISSSASKANPQVEPTVEKPIQALNTKVQNLVPAFNLLQEELDILWWLFGERTRSHEAHFSENSHGVNALVTAHDLAELISFRPGPFASEAFLLKAIASSKGKMPSKITLRDAINKIPLKWAEQIKLDFGDATLLNLCPLHTCVAYFAEVSGEKAWEARVTSNNVIDLDSSLSLPDLTVQFYQECLLLKAE